MQYFKEKQNWFIFIFIFIYFLIKALVLVTSSDLSKSIRFHEFSDHFFILLFWRNKNRLMVTEIFFSLEILRKPNKL